jgi:transposase InsO family protein
MRVPRPQFGRQWRFLNGHLASRFQVVAVERSTPDARGWKLERVMSDNASEFRSATFQQTVAKLGARHTFVRAGRPQTNGCVERVQQTILEECWKPAFARYLIPKQTGLRLDLERYLRYYNTERAHTGRWTRGRTPEEVLGKAKLWQKTR